MNGSVVNHLNGAAVPEDGSMFHGPRLGQAIVCPVLIGREAELAVIDNLIAAARARQGGTLLIAGEAGVGKSRLVAQATSNATFPILQGHCFEPDRRVPFAAVVDLLRGCCGALSPDQIAERFGAAGSVFSGLIPELTGIASRTQLEPEQEKRRLIQALLNVFAGPAAPEPALIVIEDIHWSDASSLEFLLHLARRTRERPLLLVLTYREDETTPEVNRFLASLDRERLAIEITVKPLQLADVDVMLRTIFEQTRPLRPDFLQAMWTLTEGNPFFLEEALKSLVARGDIFYSDGGWTRKALSDLRIPRSVHDAVQQRLEPLSPEAREVLVLAAVAGRRFDFELLQELAGHDEHALLRHIKELIAAQLVIEESPDRFAFRHALTRQAIYGELLARERRALHVAIGSALERLHADQIDARIGDLAYHFHEGGSWEKALEYSRRAGRQATAIFSPHTAIEHFQHAMIALEQLGLPPPVEILRGRGQAYEWVGHFELARRDYQAALTAAQDSGNQRDEWHALLDLGVLWSGRDYQRSGVYFRAAQDVARAIADPLLRAHSLNRVGNWHLRVGQSRLSQECHQEALSIFESQGHREGVAETLSLLGMAHHVGADLAQATGYFGAAAELCREIDDRQGLVYSLATMAVRGPAYHSNTAAAAASLTEAASDGATALGIAREIGWRAGEAYALVRLGYCLGAQGAYGQALDVATDGLAIAEEIQHRQWMAAARCGLGAIYLDLLDGPTSRRHLEPALALGRDIGSSYWFRAAVGQLALALILDGKFDEADLILSQSTGDDIQAETLAERLTWHARGELALARGDAQRALDIADRLSASAHGNQIIPRLAFLRGRALLALHRETPAHSELKAALATAIEHGTLPLIWRIQVSLGLEQDANESLHHMANSIPDESARDGFLERARAGTLSRPAALTSATGSAAFECLTRRERDVAALVAQGKSNRAIADELIVSERTVETHVSNILGKLEFGSRAQIAAWAVRSGLVSTTG